MKFMDTDKLTLVLIPDHGSHVQVVLSPLPLALNDFVLCNMDDMILNREYVYSDKSYSATLDGVDEKIEELSFFINDEIRPAYEESNRISFVENKRIFTHNYGFIQITIRIRLKNGRGLVFYSNFIPVLVLNELNNRSVERMVEYIYAHREQFLWCGHHSSMQSYDLKAKGKKDLESYVQIIQDVIKVYNETIGYFRLNARFKLSPTGQVDCYEKVKSVSSRTISYIVTHPEQLMHTSASTGIRAHRQNFIPNKTLVEENVIDYDIYENKIVVGFLRSLYVSVDGLIKEIVKRIKQFPDKREIEYGYFISAAFAYSATKQRLEKNKEKLNRLLENIEGLYVRYREIFPVSNYEVFTAPQPSAILISVRAYRLIYEQIVRWFQFGMYDFRGEDFILPMLRSDKIYEYYILLKIYNYIISKGYSPHNTTSYNYPNIRFTAKSITNIPNTFLFKNDNTSIEITLYYEPIIYEGKNGNMGVNTLGLFRNNSHSIGGEDDQDSNTGSYYHPDYVIKIQRAERCEYVVLDAKFSKLHTTRRYYVCKLLYRYIASISTIDPKDSLLGLIIVNGKSAEAEDGVEDIYDLSPDNREVFPFAKILTLTEIQDKNLQPHEKLIDQLLQKFIVW